MEIIFIGLVAMGLIAIGGACLQNYTDSVLEQKNKKNKQKTEDLEKVETLDNVEVLEPKKECTCAHCTCNKQENIVTENVIEDIDREF